MKTKLSIITLTLLLSSLTIKAQNYVDTISIAFGDSLRIDLLSDSRSTTDALKKMDFNSIIHPVLTGGSINAEDMDNFKIETESFDDKNFKLTIKDGEEEKVIMLQITGDEESTVVETGDEPEDYEYEEEELEENLAIKNKSNDFSLGLGGSGSEGDSAILKKKSHFIFKFGLNSLLIDGSDFVSASEPYDLKPWGSRFVELGVGRSRQIKNSKFRFNYGLTFSWNNFMFDKESTVTQNDNDITITPDTLGLIEKSKLVNSYVNLPLGFEYNFGKSTNNGFRIGVIASAGFRLSTHTKVKLDEDGRNIAKERDNFFVNDFRYGAELIFGTYESVMGFVQYDFNTVFEDGVTPNVNAVAFGLRF